MNKLDHIDEFNDALKDYKLSTTAIRALSQTELVILTAPTSSGRNAIIRELLKTGNYHYIISDTTREPRVNDGVLETNGTEYWFRSEVEMLQDIRRGKFLEAAVIHNQQVSGISVREIEQAGVEGRIAITDADISGVASAVKNKPDTVCIFVLPPSYDEWQRRLTHRGEMEKGEYQRRMTSAAIELEAALKHDYYRFVLNDTIDHAVEQVNAIAKQGVVDQSQQGVLRDLAEQLLLAVRALLTTL